MLLPTGLSLAQIIEICGDKPNAKELEKKLEKISAKALKRYKLYSEYKRLTGEERLKEPLVPVISSSSCKVPSA